MARVRVDLDKRRIDQVVYGPEGRRLIHEAGEGMARLAKLGAPIRTGRLRADIASRPYGTPGAGYSEAVSFPDPDVYYGIFHEGRPGSRHFLEKAFRTYRLL